MGVSDGLGVDPMKMGSKFTQVLESVQTVKGDPWIDGGSGELPW